MESDLPQFAASLRRSFGSPSAPGFLVREEPAPPPQQPRLLDRVRILLRTLHRSPSTEKAYVAWIRRFVLFHGKRHPASMGAPEVAGFLSHLALHYKVSAATRSQALSALLFLYGEVLRQPLEELPEIARARRPVHLPVVLTREEVRAVLRQLDGTPRLMASLLYGAGLRLMESVAADVALRRR